MKTDNRGLHAEELPSFPIPKTHKNHSLDKGNIFLNTSNLLAIPGHLKETSSINARIKEERRLRGIEQKYNQIQQDYDKLWN